MLGTLWRLATVAVPLWASYSAARSLGRSLATWRSLDPVRAAFAKAGRTPATSSRKAHTLTVGDEDVTVFLRDAVLGAPLDGWSPLQGGPDVLDLVVERYVSGRTVVPDGQWLLPYVVDQVGYNPKVRVALFRGRELLARYPPFFAPSLP